MYRNNSTRVFSTILIILIVIAIVVGIVTVIRYMAGNTSSNSNEPSHTDVARSALLDTSGEHYVRVTARGPLIANERFVSQRVIVAANERSAHVYTGYLDAVRRKIVLANSTEAYEQFVYALDKANFLAEGKQMKENQQDIRGICATGRIYEYEIIRREDGGVVHRAWTSTCKGSPGSFGANYIQINNLFTAQIPDGSFEFAKYNGDD